MTDTEVFFYVCPVCIPRLFEAKPALSSIFSGADVGCGLKVRTRHIARRMQDPGLNLAVRIDCFAPIYLDFRHNRK